MSVGPVFAPEHWGPAGDVQYNNNCYSYACDIKAAYAQPGLGSGRRYRTLTCDDIRTAAIADGLVPAKPEEVSSCKDRCHLVALAVAPDSSFHWYRRDSDGTWSHKPGDTTPTKLDCMQNEIRDPRLADRGAHTCFGGFFWVFQDNVRLK